MLITIVNERAMSITGWTLIIVIRSFNAKSKSGDSQGRLQVIKCHQVLQLMTETAQYG